MKITDVRSFVVDCFRTNWVFVKVYTDEGLTGVGEATLEYKERALTGAVEHLRDALLGKNPLEIERHYHDLFRDAYWRGGAVLMSALSAVECALWDLLGKQLGVPVYQLLGGKFRDKIRVYCDTDVEGRHTGHDMGLALKARMEAGFTFLKMDLGIGLLIDEPGTLTAPLGFLEELKTYGKHSVNAPHGSMDYSQMTKKSYEVNTVAHPFTGIHLTEKGLDMLENYVREVRDVIGYDVPLAIDHFGHICVEDCIRFLRRVEKYNLAWVEDLAPWHFTEHYVRLRNSTTVPIATGEDIYLKENFEPLMKAGGVSLIHPDVLTTGGMLETKKIGDMAYDYGVAVALHMAESPIGAMAAVHVGAALPQLMCMEYHSVDVPYWQDVVNGLPRPLIDHGFITVPDAPGLGIESLNEELIEKLVCKNIPGVWEPTDNWDNDICNDRLWS